MSSPLVRAWFAARLTDWADHGYACWRGSLNAMLLAADDLADAMNRLARRHGWSARLGIAIREWDPCEIEARYLLDPPGQAIGTEITSLTGGFHTLMPCPVCHVSVGKDCITRFGNITGPHRARRDAAARQTAAETAS